MFNFDRAFFSSNHTPRLIASAKRALQDRQRDVYDSHRHRVFAVAYYMIGNEVEAEETLTRTFVRAFKAAEEPCAQNIDAALMTELRAHAGFEESVPLMEAPAIDGSVASSTGSKNIRRTDLEEAIGALPAMERLVFLLKDVEGYSTQAISDFAGVPVVDVPRLLMSARLRLRSVLATGVAVPPIDATGKSSAASAAA